MRPDIKDEKLSTMFESKFLNVYEYPFKENGHYYTASRRKRKDLVIFKSEEEYQNMLPDAVTCAVIVTGRASEPRILMNYEFRYAAGEFILAPPAGLIDEEDKQNDTPEIMTAIREIHEETGLTVKDTDKVFVVSPWLFSSPGMTDEGNAIVCAVIDLDDPSQMNHDGSLGSEVFDGFELLTKEQAKEIIKTGRDKHNHFYSIYTWVCLMVFISDMWK